MCIRDSYITGVDKIIYAPLCYTNETLNRLISIGDLQAVLSKAKWNKALTVDRIPHKFYKEALVECQLIKVVKSLLDILTALTLPVSGY